MSISCYFQAFVLIYTLVNEGVYTMSDEFLQELENDEIVDLLVTLQEIEEDLSEKEDEKDDQL